MYDVILIWSLGSPKLGPGICDQIKRMIAIINVFKNKYLV